VSLADIAGAQSPKSIGLLITQSLMKRPQMPLTRCSGPTHQHQIWMLQCSHQPLALPTNLSPESASDHHPSRTGPSPQISHLKPDNTHELLHAENVKTDEQATKLFEHVTVFIGENPESAQLASNALDAILRTYPNDPTVL